MTTSTSTSPVAGEVDVLRHQAHMIHHVVRLNVEGLSQEESLIQPRPAGNCLNWVVGHLVATYNSALPLLGQEPVMPDADLARYARGALPLRGASEARPVGELMAALGEASSRIDAGLAQLSADTLDRRAPFSPSGNPDETVRSLLTVVMFHQAYHAGQTGILRRVAGKDGAIR